MNYKEFREKICTECVEDGNNIQDDGVCEMSNNDIDNCTWGFNLNPNDV